MLLVLFLSAVSSASAWIVGQIVQTSSGLVQGHAAANTSGVSEYLGIPFGQPPTGNLRFSPPIPVIPSVFILQASTIVSCPSNSLYGPNGVAPPVFNHTNEVDFAENGNYLQNVIGNIGPFHYTEDCLRLNIWTKPQTGEAKKAVLVWIYGGAFSFGSSEDPRYNGRYLADTQDVVVVSFNYRTNIFGFPGAPNTRQNLGLLDQRLAIEWVRDNIARFGGDPSRIVLFGQSAGAGSEDYYAQAWAKDPIVSGFILESGSEFLLAPQPLNPSPWYNATKTLGCGDKNSNHDTVLACMRQKPFQEILTATQGTPGLSSILAALQFPVVADNIIVYSNYEARFARGQYIKAPLLLGNTDDEAGVASTVVQALIGAPAPQAILDLISTIALECPVEVRAKYSLVNNITAYRYRWFGYFDNTGLGVGRDHSGAYHESELSSIFGTSEDIGGPNTLAQQAIQEQTMSMWATFAKDPENGLAKQGWPKYNQKNQQIARLAYRNTTGLNLVPALTYDLDCALSDVTDIVGLILQLFQVDPSTASPSVKSILSLLKGVDIP